MREPRFIEGNVPFSQAPSEQLLRVVSGSGRCHPCPEDGSTDEAFRRRYAAILLRERGA